MIERALRRFWFDFRLPAGKLNLVRVVFFAILALDAFLMLEHAPRYGAGDFNVAHFSFFDWLPLPDRRVMVVLFLAQAYLAVRVAFGAAIELSVRLLAVTYGYTYFCSQLDAYQHHYLIFLLLVIASFVPWEKARDVAREARASGADDDPMVASWAMRLFLVQIGLLYFWAAITKTADGWLDGTALSSQMGVQWVRDLIEVFGEAKPGDLGGFKHMARLIMLGELVLAVAVVWRKLWPVAWVIGMSFHVGVELAGFEIGLFSYFMIGLYVLFIPDRWLSLAAVTWRRLTRGLDQRISQRLSELDVAGSWVMLVLTVIAGAGLLWPLPFEAAGMAIATIAGLAVATALLGLGGGKPVPARLSLGHLLACAAVLTLHLTTDQAFHYYKYLGGTARRLGHSETMKMAYQKLNQVAPGYGPAYYHLGNLANREGDPDRALELYRKAQLREPKEPRPYEAAARLLRARSDDAGALDILEVCQREVPDRADCWVSAGAMHRRANRRDQARDAARRALEIDPSNTGARSLLQWANSKQ